MAIAIRNSLVLADSHAELLKAIVYAVFGVHQASQACLGVLTSESKIRVFDQHGFPLEADTLGNGQSVWALTASNDALRSGEIILFPTWASLLEKYQLYDHPSFTGQAFLAIPLWLKGYPEAVLCVIFKDHIDSAAIDDVEIRAETLRFVLETVLWQPQWLLTLKGTISNGEPAVSLGPSERKSLVPRMHSGTERSRERDIQILRKIAQGLTNREIGVFLHLSPSSIGKDIMRICASFGVSDRLSAVAVARERGLLPPQ